MISAFCHHTGFAVLAEKLTVLASHALKSVLFPSVFCLSVFLVKSIFQLKRKRNANQHPPPKTPNTAHQFRPYSCILPSTGPSLCKRLHVWFWSSHFSGEKFIWPNFISKNQLSKIRCLLQAFCIGYTVVREREETKSPRGCFIFSWRRGPGLCFSDH